MTEFAGALCRLRYQRGWTQRTAAGYLGVSPQFYNDMEHGRRVPGDDLADRIEAEWGVAYRSPREARIEARAKQAFCDTIAATGAVVRGPGDRRRATVQGRLDISQGVR